MSPSGTDPIPTTEVGQTPIASQFYAGRYTEIVASTFDAGGPIADPDLAFVVGALTFLDRVDDAQMVLSTWSEAAPAARDPASRRTRAAGRFFLGLAAARAGYFERAHTLLVRQAMADRHAPDAWVRGFVFQGLACQRYFTGSYARAAGHALRAVQAAHAAGFVYLNMLATDLRGHALVQMGHLQRGIALLEQANQQARRVGLSNNAFAVDTSIASYVARFVPDQRALTRVEELLRRHSHDSYTRRALLTEAAVQRALRGRGRDAAQALDDADRDALRGDTRRGKVTSLLARLWVTRFADGIGACRDLVAQAHALIEPRDVGFRAELLAFVALLARADGDDAAEQVVVAELRELWRRSQHFAAKSALGQLDPGERGAVFDEDGLTPLLRAVAQRDGSALARIVAVGWYGVIPELLGLTPGRRIVLVPGEDLVVLEDHGEVVVRPRPPRWCPPLLRLLASGEASKARIVAELWGLRSYHPELHDPPVRTTIHRLRTFLAPHGDWVEVHADGYRTTVPVHLLGRVDPGPTTPSLWEEGEVPALDLHQPAGAPARPDEDGPLGPPDRVAAQVLGRLAGGRPASVPDLARALGLSPSTVLRALRGLVAHGEAERTGFARATRYRALASDDEIKDIK